MSPCVNSLPGSSRIVLTDSCSEFDLKVAMSSLAALLDYLSLLSDISLQRRFRCTITIFRSS